MTSYLDEYSPGARSPSRGVQSDTRKLKFNNIQSCLALVFVPVNGQTMVGVHLTTGSTAFHPEELVGVMREVKTALGNVASDAYIVANYTDFHARTGLGKAVKKLARHVYVCDVPAGGPTSLNADVDVKVELNGTRISAFVRRHAVILTDAAGRQRPKPNVPAVAVPGKPTKMTDRDDKPWMPVTFQPLP